ncbi:MAG: hypothetical protein Q9225_002547 [Loekoesia sp. 1 TL-2023]
METLHPKQDTEGGSRKVRAASRRLTGPGTLDRKTGGNSPAHILRVEMGIKYKLSMAPELCGRKLGTKRVRFVILSRVQAAQLSAIVCEIKAPTIPIDPIGHGCQPYYPDPEHERRGKDELYLQQLSSTNQSASEVTPLTQSSQGATPRELVLEACRRNNTSLLSEVLTSLGSPEKIADLLNNAKDGIGNHCLHLAASYGNYEVLDTLLDQENLEVDPLDRLERDTPLHKAVRFINSLSPSERDSGHLIAELLIDAGADPRIRNKGKLKPVELVDPRNPELRDLLQKAEYSMTVGDDVVVRDGEDEEGPTGSASDSE